MQVESRRQEGAPALSSPETPQFFVAGGRAHGDYRCAECGYGVTVRSTLPYCPMCRGNVWEAPTTSPFDSTTL